MQIEVYDIEGNLRTNRNKEPRLMHAVDAVAAVATGNYRAEYKKMKIGEESRSMLVSIHEKSKADKKKELAARKKAQTLAAKQLEADEAALNADEKK